MPVIATCTQSVGVPYTFHVVSSTCITRIGASSVSELLAPLRSRSGATTRTSWPASRRPLREGLDAGSVDAVVVADEYPHGA